MFTSNHVQKKMHSPFQLPELASQMTKYLNQDDLTACIRVSHDWYDHFIQFLWNEIPFFKNAFAPEATSISRHAYLISSLKTFEALIPQISHIRFPFLQKLELSSVGTSFATFPSDSSCITLNSLALKKLVLNGFEPNNPIEFWKWVSNIPDLDDISLKQTTITPETASGFWKSFCRLQSASLEYGHLPEKLMTASYSPSNMKRLSLCFTEIVPLQQQLEMIMQCKGLEYLDWSSCCHSQEIISKLCNHISQMNWPNLHALHLPFVSLDSNSLQQILGSTARWTELRFKSATWDIESFDALSRQFDTLKLLDLSGNLSFTSVMVNTVMSSCPNLRMLWAPMIKGLDIVNDVQINKNGQSSQGWICTKLTDLVLQFDLDGLDSQLLILERVASLVQLRLLDISCHGMSSYQTIKLSLDKGLDTLISLKRIYSLRFKGQMQTMTMEDIDWIIMHWKNLKYLDGELHHETNHRKVLRKALVSKGTKGY
ncbi:hypothetical protein BGZ76_007304 [Entomortierella beljakovae]|nr:hypothetical protein BGZ76_007304 [Entomortierella beljakovae]